MNISQQKKNRLVRNLPVAKFYYQGSHSHPVRRTVLLLKDRTNREALVGYELREGRVVRDLNDAPIKSFLRDEISNYGDYCRLKASVATQNKSDDESTLVRSRLSDLVEEGV